MSSVEPFTVDLHDNKVFVGDGHLLAQRLIEGIPGSNKELLGKGAWAYDGAFYWSDRDVHEGVLIRPAFGQRRLDGAVAVAGAPITAWLAGQQKLENRLKETRVQRQRYMYQSQLGVLEVNHVVSCRS